MEGEGSVYCTTCGQSNPQGARFCSACSRPFPTPSSPATPPPQVSPSLDPSTAPPRQPGPALAGGFPAPPRPPDFTNILGDTLRVYGGNWRVFFLPLLLYGLALAVPSYLINLQVTAITKAITDGLQPGAAPHLVLQPDQFRVLGVLMLLESTVIVLAGGPVRATVAFLAVEGHRGHRVGLREASQKGWDRLPAVLGMYGLLMGIYLGLLGTPVVLLALAFLLPDLILLVPALPLFLLGSIVSLYLSIALSLALPAVVVEGLGPWAGLKRSWAMTRDRRGTLFGVYLVLGLLVTAVSYALTLPAGLLTNPVVSAVAQAIATGIIGSLAIIGPAVAYDLTASYRPPYPAFGYAGQPALP